MKIWFITIILFYTGMIFAKEDHTYQIDPVQIPPIIDGVLNDATWGSCQIANDFTQISPYPGQPMTEKCEIMVTYDDEAIYIGAKLYDSNPDSIERQIVGRDGIGNSDFFGIIIDTYHNQQEGYQFLVTASGTQRDVRISQNGGNNVSWDAIWESSVSIFEKGWIVEMAIPFSAFRYPKGDNSVWGLNIYRSIRRKAETGSWNPVVPEISGDLNQMGTLVGLPLLKSTRQIILTPYISSALQVNPSVNKVNNRFARAYRGGMDLRVALNESFIMDMTLIPDFGEVQSDNTVLNLSYSEVRYGENRPFFNEGMELFSSGLFYSRRIGGKPSKYGEAYDQLRLGETVIENPSEAMLVNATKITGRNRHNLGIGVFNAITAETYAVIQDTNGVQRKFLTEPLVNYDVFALDQSLKNNSSISFINANTHRVNSKFRQANASELNFKFYDHTNTYFLNGNVKKTFTDENQSITAGNYNSFELGKQSGVFQYAVGQYQEGNHYQPNDLGYIGANNESTIHGHISYHLFQPRGILLNGSLRLWGRYKQLYKPRVFSDWKYSISATGTFKNYLFGSISFERQPNDADNYEEPRRDNRDRKVVAPSYNNLSAHFSTDSRKKLGLSSGAYLLNRKEFNETGALTWISSWFRLSDQSSFGYSIMIDKKKNNYGWVTSKSDSIIFGKRNIQTIENNFSFGYMISKDLSLGFRIRHYWTKGSYPQYYLLAEDGRLDELDWNGSSDFNYNAFNLDFNFSWRFLTLSELNISVKDAFRENSATDQGQYLQNLQHILGQPQVQTVSLKLLYYFDTASLIKPKKSNSRR